MPHSLQRKALAFGLAAFTPLVFSHSVLAQVNRIAPRAVDEWYNSRLIIALLVGLILGALVAGLWLPRILPQPHKDDKAKPRKHTLLWFILTNLLLLAAITADVTMNREFGRQRYEFGELVRYVLATWPTLKMIGFADLIFFGVITLWTRFSDKPYRYMIIPK